MKVPVILYPAQNTLERHLVAGEGLGIAELKERRRVSVVRGGDLVIRRVEGSNMTVVTRHGILARVVEADISCTNGYIHLIDRVMFKVRLIKEANNSHISESNLVETQCTYHDMMF